MPDRQLIHLRLDEPLKNVLEGLAAHDARSLNNYITRVLETHVRAEMERLGVDYDTRATPEEWGLSWPST